MNEIIDDLTQLMSLGECPCGSQAWAHWDETLARACVRIASLEAALEPSDETKAAFMGEFSHEIDSPCGGDRTVRHQIPWTTIKDIMRAIRAHADAKGDA